MGLAMDFQVEKKRLDRDHAVVLLSGGMDSATLLYGIRERDSDVLALSVDYGQRHYKELECARMLCTAIEVKHRVADLSGVRFCFQGGSQTDPNVPVPEGHYADASMSQTVVPNRNMILLSLAVGLAISTGRGTVAYAAHSGDHPIYPDCRPGFIEKFGLLAAIAWYEPVHLYSPFQDLTKANIVSFGQKFGVPWEKTWSCYKGGVKACGRCGTCVERLEAFEKAGIKDPLEYE